MTYLHQYVSSVENISTVFSDWNCEIIGREVSVRVCAKWSCKKYLRESNDY